MNLLGPPETVLHYQYSRPTCFLCVPKERQKSGCWCYPEAHFKENLVCLKSSVSYLVERSACRLSLMLHETLRITSWDPCLSTSWHYDSRWECASCVQEKYPWLEGLHIRKWNSAQAMISARIDTMYHQGKFMPASTDENQILYALILIKIFSKQLAINNNKQCTSVTSTLLTFQSF